jgi:hypothetical protein
MKSIVNVGHSAFSKVDFSSPNNSVYEFFDVDSWDTFVKEYKRTGK